MEQLQKALADQEAKVEAGFLQLYRWQEIDRTELGKFQTLMSQKVDVSIFNELSQAQKECYNQLDDLVIQLGLAQAPAQQTQEELQRKIQLLREDVDAMKSNVVVETQVTRAASLDFIRHPQLCQELENLIHSKPCDTIQKLSETVEGINEKLKRTETNLNCFKCEEFPKEVDLVKSGLNKVVNDLKEIFGTGRRPQTLSDELDIILNKINLLTSEVQHVKSSMIQDQKSWYSQQKSRIEATVALAVKKVSDLVPEANTAEIVRLGNQTKSDELGQKLEVVTNAVSSNMSNLNTLAEEVKTVKSILINNKTEMLDLQLLVEKSTVHKEKLYAAEHKDYTDWCSQQQSQIEDTVQLAVRKLSTLVPESKAALSKQVQDEIMKLGNQTKWEEFGEKLKRLTEEASYNLKNFSSLAEEIKNVKITLIEDKKGIKSLSNNIENLNCLAEEVKNFRFNLTQDKKGIEDLQAQVANSRGNQEKYSIDLANLGDQIASIQSNISSYLEFEFTRYLEGPALQNQINTIQSKMNAKIDLELKRVKDEIVGAMNLEGLRKSQVRFGKAAQTHFHIDPSLQHDVQQKRFACSKAHINSSRHNAIDISSDEEKESIRFWKQKQSHAPFLSTSPSPRPNHTNNLPHQSTSRNPYSHQRNLHSSPTSRIASPLRRKGKYSHSGSARGNPEGIKSSSVRKDRAQMNAQSKDEDQNLSLALQHHLRFLTSTKRDKNDCLRLATEQDLEILPTLDQHFRNFPLPVNAPYLLTRDQVSISFLDDANVRHAFVKFIEQKARQYGVPFVGLAIENGPISRDWNSRTSMLIFDTLLYALQAGEYPQYCYGPSGPNATRLQKLLDCHLKYQLELIERVSRDAGFVESSRKSDRRSGRRVRLASRRRETCQQVQELLIYSELFEDERLCSSDESMDDPLDEDKIRHIPPWRSQIATALVNRVDTAYKELRRNEYPKKTGRKPSKRITVDDPVISDSRCWPNELPEDCYSQVWLKGLEPQQKTSLKAQEPILGAFLT